MYKITIFIMLMSITLNSVQSQIDELEERIDNLIAETDTIWIMISTFLVMFMQAGFAMLEMGTVRSKNASNILLKNLLDISFATIIWFVVGYGIA